MNLQPLGPKPNALPSWATSRFMVRPIGVEPITFWSVVKRSIQLSYERTCLLRIRLLAHKIIFSRWWLQLESNQRHQDFQSCALPTELWSQNKWRFRRELNPRSLAWQASVITATPRNRLVAGDGFEPPTFGLWAQRATRLLYPAMLIYNGGGRGIWTPAPISRSPGFQDRSLQPDLGIPP